MTDDAAAGPPLVDRRELARVFACSQRVTFEWETAGLPCHRGGRGKRTRYDLAVVHRWLRDRDEAHRESVIGVDAARARQLTAAAEKLEVENQLRAGELLEREDVERVWGRFVMASRQRFLNWPQVLAPRLVVACEAHGLAGVVSELELELRHCLHELAGDDEQGVDTLAPPEGST